MGYRFMCPYCFEYMSDDEVHFRSEKYYVDMGDTIPEGYDDKWDFALRYKGKDKDIVLSRIREREYFLLGKEDPEYHDFWDEFNGTTEFNLSDERTGVKAYERQVIDPTSTNEMRRAYLRTHLKVQPDGGFLIRDEQGMVEAIQLASGELCRRRVCKHCHNPLPQNYGKNNVRFVTVIGVTGSGKTVYLSQLLRNMKEILARVGLSAAALGDNAANFINQNYIEAGKPLPNSTPTGKFQQPLFYDLTQSDGGGSKTTDTLVLYDVAGEVLTDPHLVTQYARFVEHADAFILLIDPQQFGEIRNTDMSASALYSPTKVLDTIHGIVAGSSGEKCNKPCAVCISKVDMKSAQNVFDHELLERIAADVEPIKNSSGLYSPLFNAEQHNPIAQGLYDWLCTASPSLAQQMQADYGRFSYFAFSALGCGIKESKTDGAKCRYPVGPVIPRRIEEPLLWVFNQFGYIGANDHPYRPGLAVCYCPECGSDDTAELEEGSFVKAGVFGKKYAVNRVCNGCGHKWLNG